MSDWGADKAGLFPVKRGAIHWMFDDGTTTPIEELTDHEWWEALFMRPA